MTLEEDQVPPFKPKKFTLARKPSFVFRFWKGHGHNLRMLYTAKYNDEIASLGQVAGWQINDMVEALKEHYIRGVPEYPRVRIYDCPRTNKVLE